MDARELLDRIPSNTIHACVTDPPYEIGYCGKAWDKTGIAFDPEFWRSVRRVLRPGGHLLSFGATRTIHRITCAIEDAGFEIRDQIAWIHSKGMPKGRDAAKLIDKHLGVEPQTIATKATSKLWFAPEQRDLRKPAEEEEEPEEEPEEEEEIEEEAGEPDPDATNQDPDDDD